MKLSSLLLVAACVDACIIHCSKSAPSSGRNSPRRRGSIPWTWSRCRSVCPMLTRGMPDSTATHIVVCGSGRCHSPWAALPRLPALRRPLLRPLRSDCGGRGAQPHSTTCAMLGNNIAFGMPCPRMEPLSSAAQTVLPAQVSVSSLMPMKWLMWPCVEPPPLISIFDSFGKSSFIRKSWLRSTTASHIKSSKPDTAECLHCPHLASTSRSALSSKKAVAR
mmetsp:Transcript_63743/g.184880  ORF Transcript_63743/g.184880 Transcript_63743/m.184880 type:complete len:220 (-) Transcript_63743:699-1358(-)